MVQSVWCVVLSVSHKLYSVKCIVHIAYSVQIRYAPYSTLYTVECGVVLPEAPSSTTQ